MDVADLQLYVSDGRGFYSGSLRDLSRHGLCMEDLPMAIDPGAHDYSIIVSGDGQIFKLIACPRWSGALRLRKTIGVEITDPPADWLEYIADRDPLTHPDQDQFKQ